MIDSYKKLKYYIYSDVYRTYGRYSRGLVAKSLLVGKSLKYLFFLRICNYLFTTKQKKLCRLCWLFLRRYETKFGIEMSYQAEIGPGLAIPHTGGIVVASKAIIGKNCLISQNVTIGATLRGPNKGQCPVIGDNVYLGPGSIVFGNISIGHNVAVGSNSVVDKDVPENSVIVGIPGKIISDRGSIGIIEKMDY